ncbi:MAG TPA: hypothetical protein VLB80_00170 [Candidatus Babeliales bacterium]|nr:hypothetical protein [Candidatus Babeliales bacterium]
MNITINSVAVCLLFLVANNTFGMDVRHLFAPEGYEKNVVIIVPRKELKKLTNFYINAMNNSNAYNNDGQLLQQMNFELQSVRNLCYITQHSDLGDFFSKRISTKKKYVPLRKKHMEQKPTACRSLSFDNINEDDPSDF